MLRCIIFIFRTRLLTFFILLIKRLYSAHANSLQKPETLVFSVCYIRKKYFLRKGIDSFFRAGARCGTPVTDQSGFLGAACRCLLVGRPTRASHFHTTAFFSSTYEIFSYTFVHRLQVLVGRETNKGFSLSHTQHAFVGLPTNESTNPQYVSKNQRHQRPSDKMLLKNNDIAQVKNITPP